MAKSAIEKEFEKQAKETKKAAREAAIRSQAQGIVEGARKTYDGFRIMDKESEELLSAILDQYHTAEEQSADAGNTEGENNFTFNFVQGQLPDYLQKFYYVGCEALKMYGMLAGVLNFLNGSRITLTSSGKSYFSDKEAALKRQKEELELRKLEAKQRQESIDKIGNHVVGSHDELVKGNDKLEATNDALLLANKTLKEQLSNSQKQLDIAEQQLNAAENSLSTLRSLFSSSEDGVAVEKVIMQELQKNNIGFKEKGADVGVNVVAGIIIAALQTYLQTKGIL